MDVRKAANLFEQMNVPIIGVVENMSYYIHQPRNEKIFIFGNGGGKRLSMEIGAPFLGEIPIDPELCKNGDEGRSLFENPSMKTASLSAFEEFSKLFIAHVTSLKQLQKNALSSFEILWREM
jgi:ATP-binding protein involved in chromosome partitioning